MTKDASRRKRVLRCAVYVLALLVANAPNHRVFAQDEKASPTDLKELFFQYEIMEADSAHEDGTFVITSIKASLSDHRNFLILKQNKDSSFVIKPYGNYITAANEGEIWGFAIAHVTKEGERVFLGDDIHFSFKDGGEISEARQVVVHSDGAKTFYGESIEFVARNESQIFGNVDYDYSRLGIDGEVHIGNYALQSTNTGNPMIFRITSKYGMQYVDGDGRVIGPDGDIDELGGKPK